VRGQGSTWNGEGVDQKAEIVGGLSHFKGEERLVHKKPKSRKKERWLTLQKVDGDGPWSKKSLEGGFRRNSHLSGGIVARKRSVEYLSGGGQKKPES